MRTLETARKEREEHVQAIAKLDKVIAVLTGQPDPVTRKKKRGHPMSAEARQKMKDAWARRKKKKQLSAENRQSESAAVQ